MSSCPYANLVDPDTYAKGMPYEELKKFRDLGPVIKMEDPITGVPYWAVVHAKEIDFISKNPLLFSSETRSCYPMEHEQAVVDTVHKKMLINIDPPIHLKMRRLVRDAFKPKMVNSYEDKFLLYAKQIIDKVASRGECEFVSDVAAELPLLAILELMGVDLDDRHLFFEWTNIMMFADDPDMSTSEVEGQVAAANVIAYAKKLAEKHRKEPMNNITGALLDGKVDGVPLSEDNFVWTFILIMVAGNESTRAITSQGMRLLMEHPDQLQYLVDNPDKIANATEEMLRYNTAFISMRRTANQDIEVGGQLIKKGDKVVMHYHAANHDEAVFGEDSMKFDVRRAERTPSIATDMRSFGIGEHFCIGAGLARLELKVIFEELIPRLRNPKLKTPPKFVRSYFVNSIKEMNITFDPEG
jgi:cholest-4-en-3-one 26-monooxygenase